jgi:hypothetical protein
MIRWPWKTAENRSIRGEQAKKLASVFKVTVDLFI